MTGSYNYHKIPLSRIATFDVYSIGMSRHHVSALLEFDVTESRKKLKESKKNGVKVTFNAWMVKLISKTIKRHPEAASYLISKRKLITFDNINISLVVEKEMEGKKVPVPVVIEKANEKAIPDIVTEIENAKKQYMSHGDIVLNRQPKLHEKMYYRFPAVLRKAIWRYMLKHPRIAYKKMGNVVITSLGMMGRINGWFVYKTVHPISFGIGSIIKKPVVINDEIQAREVLNMTVLMDHDVIDGAPMVRFIKDLTKNIENGDEL